MTFTGISKNLNWGFGKLGGKAVFHGLAVLNPPFQTSIIPSFRRPMGWLWISVNYIGALASSRAAGFSVCHVGEFLTSR